MINSRLFNKCEELGIDPQHVVEIGVYLPEHSNILGWISKNDGRRISLFEAEPVAFAACEKAFAGISGVTVYNEAVCDTVGTVELYKCGLCSTFLSTIEAPPEEVNTKYRRDPGDLFSVSSTTLEAYENQNTADIDLLCIDVEGAEWEVIKTMNSRPRVISLEMGFPEGHRWKYRNPNYDRIMSWLDEGGYELLYHEDSDMVFIRK